MEIISHEPSDPEEKVKYRGLKKQTVVGESQPA